MGQVVQIGPPDGFLVLKLFKRDQKKFIQRVMGLIFPYLYGGILKKNLGTFKVPKSRRLGHFLYQGTNVQIGPLSLLWEKCFKTVKTEKTY